MTKKKETGATPREDDAAFKARSAANICSRAKIELAANWEIPRTTFDDNVFDARHRERGCNPKAYQLFASH